MPQPLFQTDLPGIPLVARGKVRDIYDLGDSLLIVATDRLSAFDVVMKQPIPDKGRVLTQMSLFWFDLLKDVIENHLLTAEVAQFPASLQPFADQLEGRSMVVEARAAVDGRVRRPWLPRGLRLEGVSEVADRLPHPPPARPPRERPAPHAPCSRPPRRPISGHDENISPTRAAEIIGQDAYDYVSSRAIAIYQKAADFARAKGIIIADTKFEFGRFEDRLILIDEVLTPDSSRFWPAREYQVGKVQKSFDKQPVRDYLSSLGWNKQPPPPDLSPEVVAGTTARYQDAYLLLTGREL